MGTRYAEIFHGLTSGKAGQETASIDPTTTHRPARRLEASGRVPAVVASTDLGSVQTLVQSTVQGITPTYVSRQADAWSLRPANRRATPGQRTRAFHVAWQKKVAAAGDIAGWTTGGQVNEVSCLVVTDYNIPLQDAFPIIARDHKDLLEALSLLKRNRDNGIWWVVGRIHRPARRAGRPLSS